MFPILVLVSYTSQCLSLIAMLIRFLFFLFLATDEVFTVACSPTDASLVASGGKDDRGFLWRIGSPDSALELTGIVLFVIILIYWMPIIHWNISIVALRSVHASFSLICEEHTHLIHFNSCKLVITHKSCSFIIVYPEHYMKLFVLVHVNSGNTCIAFCI